MGNLKIVVWDVQHGNAIYVKTPNNKHMVFDLGVGDYSAKLPLRSPLETLFGHYGISNIDCLTITHPHRDHIDDILTLDRLGIGVTLFYRANWVNRNAVMNAISAFDRPKFDKYFEMNDRYSQQVAGTYLDIDNAMNNGGITIHRFFTPILPLANLNNHSIITVLEYEGLKVIIPGDNERPSFDQLMIDEKFKEAVKDCDVLIAPHHGRESAYHNDFITLANPRITIISDGSLCDTSANSRYSAKSRGWQVKKGTQSFERRTLTTNSDGEVYIELGNNGSSRYLNISVK